MKKIFLYIILHLIVITGLGQAPFFFNNINQDTITTVIIGTQTWIDHNISINDGGAGIYYPNGDVNNVNNFGYLYTYDAAKRIINNYYPGWRIPTVSEINDLYTESGNTTGKWKKISLDFWLTPNSGATNELLLNMVGNGRYNGSYSNFKQNGWFWTSTNNTGNFNYIKSAAYNTTTISTSSLDTTASNNACSLRLIK